MRRRELMLAGGTAMAGLALGTRPAHAKTTIEWWHAMGGANGERVNKICADFNASQSDFEVKPAYKGSYAETMTAAIAAFRAKQQPHILQVFEVGTATMMAAKGAIYPVYELMKDTGQAFDPNAFLPAVKSYYTTPEGEMLSMPFNSSTPVLWYNKDAFEKAGLDPEKPPATWPEMEEAGKKLVAAGSKSGFTTTWPSWIHIENFSAWHNLPVGTEENGFGGLGTRFEFNKTQAVMHTAKLAEWQKAKIFDYGGRTGSASPKFFSADAAMMTESSAGLAGVKSSAKFKFGIGFLPYWPSIEGAPQNTIIGGASLWTLQGHPKDEYKAVAAFYSYLSSPKVQAWWHQETGYLPITTAAYELSKEQGYYEKNPGADISIKQMTLHPPTGNSKGMRFGNMVQIRDVINEEQERAFSGQATAQEALDAAVKRGNAILEQFQKQHS